MPKKSRTGARKSAPQIKNLPKAAIQKALETAGAKRINFPTGTVLYRQGDPADSIFYIAHGKIHITVISPQGKEGLIALLSDGAFIGEASLTSQLLYLESATTVSACEIITISPKGMHAVLQTNLAIAEYFTHFLLQRSIDAQVELVDHLFNSSEKRLARILLQLANFGHEGKLERIPNMTQALLAERVGTTRARISFFMNKFRRLGLIEYNGSIKVNSGLLNVVLNDARLKSD